MLGSVLNVAAPLNSGEHPLHNDASFGGQHPGGTLALASAGRLTGAGPISIAAAGTFDVTAQAGGFTLGAGQAIGGDGGHPHADLRHGGHDQLRQPAGGAANAYALGIGVTAYFQEGSLQVVVVPEPAGLALAGLGSVAAAWALVRRRFPVSAAAVLTSGVDRPRSRVCI